MRFEALVNYGYQPTLNVICTYSKKPRHTKATCYKLIGYSLSYFENPKPACKNTALVVRNNPGKISVVVQVSNFTGSNTWIYN